MPNVSAEPQLTSNQKSINWKRILIVAVIGAAVIGLGVLIFFILRPIPEPTSKFTDKKSIPAAKISTPSAKKDETADWTTYQNTDVGFQLKYPSSVSTHSTAYSSGSAGYAILSIKGPTQTEGTDIHDGMYIFIKTLNFLGSLENVAKEDQESIKGNEYGILVTVKPKPEVGFDIEQVTIGEVDWVSQKIVIDGKKIDDKFIYVRLKDGEVLRIHGKSGGENYTEYNEIIDKILSTFKFLD